MNGGEYMPAKNNGKSKKRYFLVDYENVKTEGFQGIDELEKSDTVIIFYSANADKMTFQHQASLSFTDSRSLLKLTSIELVMLYNHLIFCHPSLLSSIFPSIRVFSNESALCIRWPKCWRVLELQLQHQSFQ